MTATTHRHRTARVTLAACALALITALLCSGIASARQTYEAPLVRHQAKHHVKKHKRSHRRARAAAVTIDLCAKAGTTTLPDGATLPIWGFVKKVSGSCGPAEIPGPPIEVDKNDPVTINVENQLPDELALDIPGITLDPGPTHVAPGATRTITFTSSAPGTYMYESSGGAGRQAEVGLAGALVVKSLTPGRAYDSSTTAYDKQAYMVLSEITPALNQAAASTCGGQSCLESFNFYDYDSDPRFSKFKPTYRLINGKAYPQIPSISAAAGDKVLLRYVNAGSEMATTTMLGIDARLVGRSGSLLGAPFDFVAETFPAGSAADAIVTVPSGAASGTKFPIYDRHLGLVNGSPASNPGGRIRYIEVQ